MMLRDLSIFVGLVSFLTASAAAQDAPQALRGKSVVADWTETRLQRLGSVGEFNERSVQQNLSTYISTEGRVFAKRTIAFAGNRRTGFGSRSSVGQNSTGGQQASVRGHTLTVVSKFASGARMAKIDFDANFSSCTATIILGRENGNEIMRGRSLTNGSVLEMKSVKVSNPTCSIRAGNVFGE